MRQKHLLVITALLSLLLMLIGLASLRAGAASPFIFGKPQTIDADQAVASLAVGDFNGNGRFDVAAFSGEFNGNASNLMHWYEAPTMRKHLLNASYFPDEIKQFPGAAAAADIDRDGDTDLVLGNADRRGNQGGEIIWLENPASSQSPNPTGDWVVHPVVSFAQNAGHMNDISLTDLDGDGKIDIVMRHLSDAETLRILFQDDAKANQWTLRSIGDLPFREGMGTADLDSDGDPDIMLNGYWLETPANPRTDTFPQHVLDPFYTSQPQSGLNNSTKQAFGDLNGDGKIDVVLATAEGDDGWLAWYAQPENPTVDAWPRVRLQETTGMHTLELGDIDNDGDLDILTGRSLGSSGIAVWENQQNGQTFVEHEINNQSSYTGRLFDADGDGDLDLVSQSQCCRDNGDLYWIENLLEDTPPPPPVPTATPIPPELLTTHVHLPFIAMNASPAEPEPPVPDPTPLPPSPVTSCPEKPTVLYDFMSGSGSTLFDVASSGSPLNLTIEVSGASWLPNGGLTVSSASRLASAGPAIMLISAVQQSNELTIEMWIEPANVTQDGPARILTLSGSSATRNVTVGQGLWGDSRLSCLTCGCAQPLPATTMTASPR